VITVPRLRALVLFLLFGGAGVGSVLARDASAVSAALVAVALGAFVAMLVLVPQARAAVADALPPVTWIGRRVMALQWRAIALVVAGCVGVLLLAEAWDTVAAPRGRLADHLVDAYGPELRDPRPPLLVAAELDDQWPADDQRYTAVGVLLRYERDIVALLPERSGGTRIVRQDPVSAFRRFHDYVGDFWGDRYHARDHVPRSALAVPSDDDVLAVTRRLAAAQRAQRVCFSWDVEIRSGRRAGRFTGPAAEERCQPYLRLVGWVDPLAGRLSRRRSPGDWSLAYEWNVPHANLDPAALRAIDTPQVELIEGATQQPSGDGRRAGKGLLEHLDAMPLLAAAMPGVPPVPPPMRSPSGVPARVRPAAAERTDAERRADDSWVAIPPRSPASSPSAG